MPNERDELRHRIALELASLLEVAQSLKGVTESVPDLEFEYLDQETWNAIQDSMPGFDLLIRFVIGAVTSTPAMVDRDDFIKIVEELT